MTCDTRRAFVIDSLSLAALAALTPGALGHVYRSHATPLDPDQAAAFIAAVKAGERERVQAMLLKDASLVGARDEAGRSVFAVALLHRHVEIAGLIREAGHEPDVHESALALDWDRFNELAAADDSTVNGLHAIGGTAMTAAALGGAGSQIWRVYAQGAVPNPPRPDLKTPSPVRAALDFPDLDTAELGAAMLLGNGADPNQPEPGGSTALHAAAARGSVEIVEMLIRKNARIDVRDAAGRTPEELAAHAGHHAVVEMLRDHRAIPRDHDSSRRAYDVNGKPCHAPDWDGVPYRERGRVVGVSHGNLDAVREALGRDPRLAHSVATTTEGAVEAGAHMGNQAIVELLLEHGAPYSMPTAVMRGDIGRVKSLLAEDPRRIHERGAHDFALLWYPVIGGGHLELAELLLDAGADVERQHHLGTTALHWAARRGQIDLVALFIERGADVNRSGRKFGGGRETPLQAAERHEDIVKLLRRHEAVG